ncbi:hypothetical protein [Yinghuangia soli]|uniref:Uncharacterized protein n=1 Tax=Yinghuangia soli TaxID=2908204 RepID=A0AA41U7L0_9ACTN|nr:hypothetical protein [Yinghuangia soli]MCF2532049.1 hypothetical protein [Yinghuangia soli]
MARKPQQPDPAAAWLPIDDYLWHTCDIVADIVEGRVDRRPRMASMARLQPGERVLACGPAQRFTLRQAGDGSYRHQGGFAFGSPAFVAGAVAVNAMGNAARRRQAAQDMVPRWMPDGGGEATITEQGVYLAHPISPLTLGFTGLDAIDLPTLDAFEGRFRDVHSGHYISIRLHSPWAPLMFVLGALAAFPAHPRLLGGAWLPPGFLYKCAVYGRPVRPVPDVVPGMAAAPAPPPPPSMPPSVPPPPHNPYG